MHIAESILNNLQTTFEGIFNVGNPIPDSENSELADGICIVTGGQYSDVENGVWIDRDYELEIVTGGMSGIAECTITDITYGNDSVSGNVLIVSNQEINLGSKGAKITFTIPAGEELTLGDKWLIQCKNYSTNVRTVIQAQASPQHLESLPGIAYAFTSIPYRDNGESNKSHCEMSVAIELWLKETENQKIQPKLLSALKDLEHALMSDPSRGGNAQDTRIINCEPYLPVPNSPFAAISVEVGIWFDNYIQ